MKLMLIDGNSIVNRAFYGVSQNLSTRDGLPTNAIYGFINILLKVTEEEHPDGLAIAFDTPAPSFRHLSYSEYKAQRKRMPEELAVQIPVLKEVLDAMNIRRYELEGWEADDLLGTMTARNEAEGCSSVIITGDRDALQLVTDLTTVNLITTRMGQTSTKAYTPDVFREQYGFDPIHLIDLKALMGDSSDNIPGVRGVGEKTAISLIRLYHTIDEIYDRLPDIEAKPAMISKLMESEESARMSYDLATIRKNVPIDFHPSDAAVLPYHSEALYQILLRLEFSKLIDRLNLSGQESREKTDSSLPEISSFEIVDSVERMRELLNLFRGQDHVSFLPLSGLKGVCVCYEEKGQILTAVFLPGRLDCYSEFLRSFFSPGIHKISHDIKNLMGQLLKEDLSLDDFVFDTAIAAYLLAPTDGSYDLDKLSMTYFNLETPKPNTYQNGEFPDSLFCMGPSIEQDSYEERTKSPLAVWIAHTVLIERLYQEQKKKLEEFGLETAFYEIDLPLCPVLAKMERTGFLVDGRALREYGAQLQKGIHTLEKEIYDLAGEPFNILSTKQLGSILFEKLGLPPLKKTKTGYSTNAEVMEKLRPYHEIVGKILDYRQLTKLCSTYVDGLSKVIAQDGRIHTCFQNTVTATGRLSSTEPNLQNIPVRTPLGAEMRKMFSAAPGNVLVDADYSQIELRLLAHLSQDQAMISAFQKETDIHTGTACQIFEVSQDEVTPDMRRAAKAVNFGIVYGISAYSLSEDIHVSVAQAREYMDKYFEDYPGIRAYMDHVVSQGRENGYVSTLYGRRRWLPELKSSNFHTRSFGERIALNMPIQGTAADVIKLAMLRVDHRLSAESLKAKLVLQVHDELIVECPESESEVVKALLKEEMEQVVRLSVPLTTEAKSGKTWADAH